MKKHLMNGKKKNIKEIKNRMAGWQLESFKESYENKISSSDKNLTRKNDS